ncbi:hydroxymethylbilane synthase [Cellulosilyticum sp. I15G10I2]|uniref:hydroxymethylbilane synthase n=1 Tax=Cellulosilyticum sp. I15G10I2 TaxID=1892843 RepID=UPI00085BC0ED|nr:hydroxymethylbilane synthase [Cellulosilyticum sp. I15G10I2]
MKKIVGTRGSMLALTQTKWVISELKKHHPNIEFEIKVIKTTGDRVQNQPLDKIGEKGLFTKEIEEHLLSREIDLAVHSMKDMPSVVPEGLKFSYVPKREDARDILVLKEGYTSLEDLPYGAKIGTGSKRRKYQLLSYRPDLKIVPIRGNIDTRIRKLKEEGLEGIVLAAAGVHRLGMNQVIGCYLPVEIMIPAAAQGALALEVRANDVQTEELLKPLHDGSTEIQIKAERAFLSAINGGCHMPVGAYCTIHEEHIILRGLFGDEEGKRMLIKSIEGQLEDAEQIGCELANRMLKELKGEKR